MARSPRLSRIHLALIALGVAAVAWIALVPTLDNSFIDVDDGDNFLENHAYRGFGIPQVIDAFSRPRASIYQPLNSLLWSLVYCVWGLDPRGYHLASVALHALNAVVLFGLVREIVARWLPDLARERPVALASSAGLAVAWFAAHPARVEPVAWATTLLYLSCTFFALLSTLAYLRANPPGGAPLQPGWRAGAFALAAAAMLCMPGAVCLPFLFLILDASLLGRINLEAGTIVDRIRRSAVLTLEKLPLLLAAVALTGLAYWAKRSSLATPLDGVDGVWTLLAQVGFRVWYPLIKAVFPFGIGNMHPRPEGGDFEAPIFVFATIGLVVALAVVVALRRRVRWLPAASAAYLLISAPHIFNPMSEMVAADRYAYLASTVLVIPLAAGLARLVRSPMPNGTRAGMFGASLVLIAALAIASRSQATIWRDAESYWGDALRRLPGSSLVHSRYGLVLARAGKLNDALAEYDLALTIRPHSPGTLIKRGAALAALGRLDEALATDRAALAIWPDDAIARLNLGIALGLAGRPDEAIGEIRRAIAADPSLAPARVKLGDILLQQGRTEEATTAYREALKLAPEDAHAWTSLGAALALRGDTTGAIEAYESALRESPQHIPALLNLGIAQARSSLLQEAIQTLTTATGLDPSNADAHHALGVCLAGAGQLEAAVNECAEALRLDPRQNQARQFLEQARRQGLEPSIRR
jgi:protein O-mannosyl-transferase